MFEFFFVVVGALFVRLFPLRSMIIDYDSWGHLYVANEVKKQNASPWGEVTLKCWQSDKYRHPYLWHWVVGRLPLEATLANLKWINGVLDAAFATLLYWIMGSIFSAPGVPLIGILLYLFTPMWFSSLSIGTRVASFTPRLVSEHLVNLMLVLVFFDLGMPHWLQLALATVITSCIILTSKFGVQALLFITPSTVILANSSDLLLALLVGILLPIILSRGEVLKVLKRQVEHLIDYYRNNKSSPNEITNRNKFNNIVKKSSSSKSGFDLSGSIWSLLATNSYTGVIFKMPLFLVVISLAVSGLSIDQVIFSQYIYPPIITATALYFLINRPALLFLGEAERYLNHIAVFIIFASIDLAVQMEALWLLWGLISYGFLYWILESFLVSRLVAKKERVSADHVVEEYLNRDGHTRLVASFPYHNYCLYRVMLLSSHKVIMPVHMTGSLRQQFVEKFENRYAYLALRKLDKITDVTSLDTLIIDKEALVAEGLGDWMPPSDWNRVELSQSVYHIYER